MHPCTNKGCVIANMTRIWAYSRFLRSREGIKQQGAMETFSKLRNPWWRACHYPLGEHQMTAMRLPVLQEVRTPPCVAQNEQSQRGLGFPSARCSV